MAFPTIFAQLVAGVQPLSDFDTMFSVIGGMGTIFCAATGSDTIALAPGANMPTVASYANYQAFGFVAVATSTAPVTLNISSVGALPAYAADGTTQLDSGNLVTGAYYLFAYNSALNSGGGGFQVISNSSVIGTSLVNIQAITTTSTYTPTAGANKIIVFCQGAGGAGAGSGSSGAGGGGTGGTTNIGTLASATGGVGGTYTSGSTSAGGEGGIGSLGVLNLQGSAGDAVQITSGGQVSQIGGAGAPGFFGTGSGQSAQPANVGGAGGTNTGGGGGGGGGAGSVTPGAGGGAGGFSVAIASASSQSVTIGAGGTAGTAGTSGHVGGEGGSGVVLIFEFR